MQVTLVESEIHQAIELYLRQIIDVNKAEEMTIDLEAKRDALGTRAYVNLTPNTIGKDVATAPKPAPTAPVVTPTPGVAVGEPVATTPTTPLGEVPAPGLDGSEAAPAEVAPAPVQSTPVPIAEPEQVKPLPPRTPAEAIEWANANPVEDEDEPEVTDIEVPSTDESTPVTAAPVEQVELDGEPEPVVEEAEVQVPNAVDPVQVVEESVVTETETEVSQPVPQPEVGPTPVAEPDASTQVEDLAPKEAEVELPSGEVVTEVTHSDPALPTGVPEPEVTNVPSDALPVADVPANGSVAAPVNTPEGQNTADPASPVDVQGMQKDAEGMPVRRSLFNRGT